MLSLITIPESIENKQEKDGVEFPQPRTGACVATLDYKMYLWGGHTQFLLEAGDDECCPIDEVLPNTEENFMDVFNILTRKWERYFTVGDIPHVGDGPTMVGYEDSLYLFGGHNDGTYNGDLYRFNILTQMWSIVELSDGGTVKPSPRYRLDSVLYDGKMCIFGGVGPLFTSLQPGAQYISTQRYNRYLREGWNNEMFFFDIRKGCWTDVNIKCPQKRPPPCASFTFNMVASHQAALFGGNQEGGNVGDVYLFDFKEMMWSDPFRQNVPEDPWPAGRSLHTACSVFDPCEEDSGIDPHLLVIWGKGRDSKHCNDIWILNTVTMKWKEVSLKVRSKMWHMTSSCYFYGKSEALIFGGNIRRSSKYERHTVPDLTILSFGVLSLKECCIIAIRKHQLHQTPHFNNLSSHMRNMVTTCQYINY